MEQQKYDPEYFDRIVVKDQKSKWSLFVPICFMAVVTFLYCKVMLFGSMTRAYQPGNWVGRV